ncbi:MAG: glutamate racemase [Oscillospiraceae bacterium]
MDERPIGVFDSGLGGLTAVKKLMEVLPCEDIIYFGDTGRVPYGGRSRETIIKYARQDIDFLRRFDIKAVVAACGTVSTNGLDEITGDYDMPVWGVVEAAAQASTSATKNGRIGLIGTKASVRSGAYDSKIRKLLPEAEIFKTACPLFVPLVEEGRTSASDPVLIMVAEEYLRPLKEAGVDTLIMGCTHYPLIEEVLAKIMGAGVTLIDPGAETARKLRQRLYDDGLLRSGGHKGVYRYFVTDSAENFAQTASQFLNFPVEGDVAHVSLDIF